MLSLQISCDTNVDNIVGAIEKYGILSTSGEDFLKCQVLGDLSVAVKGATSMVTLVVK